LILEMSEWPEMAMKNLESLMIEDLLIITKENRIIGKWILAGACVCIALLVRVTWYWHGK
jgi:hypothetical protein